MDGKKVLKYMSLTSCSFNAVKNHIFFAPLNLT
jgi:hypothetical protein